VTSITQAAITMLLDRLMFWTAMVLVVRLMSPGGMVIAEGVQVLMVQKETGVEVTRLPLIQTFNSSSAEAYSVADVMEVHWAQRGDRNAVICQSNNALKMVLVVMGNRFFKAISLFRWVVGVESN